MRRFVWDLHGGWKAFLRCLWVDGALWVTFVFLAYMGELSWPAGLLMGVILLHHALIAMHLQWYRKALPITQNMLDKTSVMQAAQKWKKESQGRMN